MLGWHRGQCDGRGVSESCYRERRGVGVAERPVSPASLTFLIPSLPDTFTQKCTHITEQSAESQNMYRVTCYRNEGLPGHRLLGLQWGIQVSQAALAKSLFIRIMPELLCSPFQSELATVLSRILVYEDMTF